MIVSLIELHSGVWQGKVDVSSCVPSQESPPPKFQLIAEVSERGTLLAGRGILEYDAFAAGFELVPCDLLSLKILQNFGLSEIAKFPNFTARRFIGQKLGTIVELNIDLMSRCEVYVIRARRKLSSIHYSREELIVLPSLFGTKFFDFSFIRPVNPARVDYAEGDVIEVNVPPDLGLNYFMSCNSRDVIAASSVSTNGRIMIPVTSRMSGACVLYVYASKQKVFRSDMYLFFVPSSICPRDYSIKLSSKNITVFNPLDVHLQAKPQSWALLHAYDSRLESLLKAKTDFTRSKHWIFSEFVKPDDRSDLVWFSNLLKISELTHVLKSTCSKAEFKSACDNPMKGKDTQRNGNLVDQNQPQVQIAHFMQVAPSPARKSGRPDNSVAESLALQPLQNRRFWLIDSPSKVPHSVTEWRFAAGFWSEGRASMCQAPTRSVISTKQVFMDVDLPSNVYENETIQVRVTVNANVAEETNMAVCFRGLSPVVCGDVGKDGSLGETDYTRVVRGFTTCPSSSGKRIIYRVVTGTAETTKHEFTTGSPSKSLLIEEWIWKSTTGKSLYIA
uniref:Alpha-2-macroglobulin domain-containing protein n=1 Tax=Ditylenchus dipsaci TaxID=166011 RepID=A0A915EV50_9BILA